MLSLSKGILLNFLLCSFSIFSMEKNLHGYGPGLLYTFVKQGNAVRVREILTQYPEWVNFHKNRDETTPLFWVINENTLEVLLEFGADINHQNKKGETPLDWVVNRASHLIHHFSNNGANLLANTKQAKKRNLSKINKLPKSNQAGRSIRQRQKKEKGIGLFFTFVKQCKSAQVSELLQTNPEFVHFPNQKGVTPLFWVKDKETLKILLKAGADVNLQNNNGETPLHWVVNRAPSLIPSLLKQDAQVNICSTEGETPLISACCRGKLDSVESLLQSPDVDVNFQNPVKKRTALHWIVRRCQGMYHKSKTYVPIDTVVKIIKLLRNCGAKTTLKDYKERRAVDYILENFLLDPYKKDEVKRKLLAALAE